MRGLVIIGGIVALLIWDRILTGGEVFREIHEFYQPFEEEIRERLTRLRG